jgi:hypothetical protein
VALAPPWTPPLLCALAGGCGHPRRANGEGQLVGQHLPARCCFPSSTAALPAGQLPQQLRLQRPSSGAEPLH